MTGLMFMGTGSDVGKSLVVAGLCRALQRRGLRVAPFKPQNMSNNAAVTRDGGEIGRAQALQARACGLAPSFHMNPVLLKPESTTGAQIIVHGKRVATMPAREFFRRRMEFMPAILESYCHLQNQYDIILVEGAGSPAEVNLRENDLANMGFASAADIPAILVGDIHRGGVIASIIGTFNVLAVADRARLKGFIINKFHGDASLFDAGRTFLENQTQTHCFGVIPHFSDARNLPAEDAVALEEVSVSNDTKWQICVLRLPRIANFDDLDPLRLEPGVSVQFISEGEVIPASCKLIIIPGSKSTVADLAALRRNGWDIDIAAHIRRGGCVFGLCGGYQMLGTEIQDPNGLEGHAGSIAGLGHLQIETTLHSDKTLTQVSASHIASSTKINAYEIHLGQSQGPDCARPFAMIGAKPDGAISPNGRVIGTYLHGCFSSDAFRSAFLRMLKAPSSNLQFENTIEKTLDDLAHHLETHLDIPALLELAR